MSIEHEVAVTIPPEAWTAGDDTNDPDASLFATILLRVGGAAVHLHVEAWAVYRDDADGIQRTVDADYDEDLDRLHAAVHAQGPFQTITIRGRDYVVVATPFS